jgi:hypothetical protein
MVVRNRGAMTRRGFVAVMAGGLVGCGSSGRPTGASGMLILGQATFPPQLGGGPVARAPVVAIDVASPGVTIPQGQTDNVGRYRVDLAVGGTLAILVLGLLQGSQVRVSGLLNPSQQGLAKDFNGTTDIACEAGLTAVADGSVPAGQLGAGRIRNLELAAGQIAGGVNFFDPAQVTAAANRVRQLTNNGANPPA